MMGPDARHGRCAHRRACDRAACSLAPLSAVGQGDSLWRLLGCGRCGEFDPERVCTYRATKYYDPQPEIEVEAECIGLLDSWEDWWTRCPHCGARIEWVGNA